jgi:hypothetical protein
MKEHLKVKVRAKVVAFAHIMLDTTLTARFSHPQLVVAIQPLLKSKTREI